MTFVDPRLRSEQKPKSGDRVARLSPCAEELSELHRLCAAGRLYEVEHWIRDGKPLQLSHPDDAPPGRYSSAMEIALDANNHSLGLLLLCNGYDPNRERRSILDRALDCRNRAFVDLLLAWGADPLRTSPAFVLESYDTDLFERFSDLGLDLTDGHAMASALGHHSSNKPLYGFARRHRSSNPKIQTELDMALVHHARKGNLRGVMLCLWAGADPHHHVPDLDFPQYVEQADEEVDDPYLGDSAIEAACAGGRGEVLDKLGLDPARDDFDALYRLASSGAIVGRLVRAALPANAAAAIRGQLFWCSDTFYHSSLEGLEHLFRAGVRWIDDDDVELAAARRTILQVQGERFAELIGLLAEGDHCSPRVLAELGRTPSMRKRFAEAGFVDERRGPEGFGRGRRRNAREVRAKFGMESPKLRRTKPSIPTFVTIGLWQGSAEELELTRAGFFELVWSKPITTIAGEWEMSDRAVGKACARAQIPVPPRGYWAKVASGQRVPRPRLPAMPPGCEQTISVRIPRRK